MTRKLKHDPTEPLATAAELDELAEPWTPDHEARLAELAEVFKARLRARGMLPAEPEIPLNGKSM
jgi:hypothetical protein